MYAVNMLHMNEWWVKFQMSHRQPTQQELNLVSVPPPAPRMG